MEKIARITLLVGLVVIIVSPWFFTRESIFFSFNEYSGYIGDTIGGITSPIINFIAAFLIYISFSEQVKANQILRNDTVINNINLRYQEIKDEFKSLNFPVDEIHINVRTNKTCSSLESYVDDLEYTGEGNISFEYHLKYVIYLISYYLDELEKSNLDIEIKKSLFSRLYQFYFSNLYFQLDLFIDFAKHHKYDVPIVRLIKDVVFRIESTREEFKIPNSGHLI